MANKARKKRLRAGAKQTSAGGNMTATVADTAFRVSHGVPAVSPRADDAVTPEKVNSVMRSPVVRAGRKRASEAAGKGFLNAAGLRIPTGGNPDGRDMDRMTVLLTPEQAAAMCGRYFGRKASENEVRCIRRSIEDGTFFRTAQCVCLDTDGNLIDGNHRATAISRHGGSVPMDIAYNCAPSSAKYMDLGRKRTVGDFLALSPCGFINCRAVASMVREAAEGISTRDRCRIPGEKLVRLAEACCEQIEWIFRYCPYRGGMTAGFYGVVLRAVLAVWDDEAKLSRVAEFLGLFHKSAHTGAADCPLNKLLQHLQKNRAARTAVKSKEVQIRTMHALSLFVSGKPLRTWSSLPKDDIWPFDCGVAEVAEEV